MIVYLVLSNTLNYLVAKFHWTSQAVNGAHTMEDCANTMFEVKYIHGNLLANSVGLLSVPAITGILNLSGCKSFDQNVTEPICLLAYLLPGNSLIISMYSYGLKE